MRVSSSMRNLTILVVVWAFVLGMATGPQPARAQVVATLSDLTTVICFGLAVTPFSDVSDEASIDLLRQREAEIAGATKVVPILRVGEAGRNAVGAAQVMGPREQVRSVQAVGELELSVGELRGRALLPVTTRSNLTSSIRGVSGVGVSSNIKFPI